MSTRHSRVVKIEANKGKSSSNSKGKLVARFRINDFMSANRISSFSTAQEFFQTHTNGFMPLNTLYAPQTDKSSTAQTQNKFRGQKWQTQIEKDLHKFVNQNKFKKTVIRQAFHLFAKDNNQTRHTILKASSVSPSPRKISALYAATEKTMPEEEPIKRTINFKMACREEAKKSYRKRIYRNRSHMHKVVEVQEESITGWNSTALGEEHDALGL